MGSVEVQPDVDYRDLLDKYGTIYSAGFTWHPSPGVTTSFQARWYFTKEDCDRATADTLKSMGYQRPRWWQWWRWNEMKPGREVSRMLTDAPSP
ncbi:hypothetical protein [Mesorhizobium sp. BE184]|uniref:hypothetical protein n=1 Tax=Mesorhizobium sp. BE184 TaxID=2817714 RepID=UPI00285A641D|nr:hypothetical protein [Mesorhizobium sp. BE184]MDR7032447.1 hypothetical protein [Mesorhizobium sp. BE184]